MSDPDKTQKIYPIKRSVPRETLIERAREALSHFESQAEIARQRLQQLTEGVAA
jgi:hypothetical protein